MKKLLVLLVVLVVAGSASATMTIVAPSEVIPGEAFAIGVDVAGEDALITDVLVIAGPASVDASGVVLADDVVTPYFEDMSGDPDFRAFVADLGIQYPVGIYYYEFVDVAVPPATLTDGALVSNVMVGIVREGEVVVALVDGANGVLRSTAVIVPEPMTVVLLGLGGLLVRRRR